MNPDIRHFLAPEDVLLDIDAPHFDALLGVLGAHIESRHGVAAQHGHAILARREALSSTAIGAGVAIPHARLDGLARSSAIYARLARPLPTSSYATPDGIALRHAMVLLVPQPKNQQHLDLLAAICRLFSSRRLPDALLACNGPAQVLALLGHWHVQSDPFFLGGTMP